MRRKWDAYPTYLLLQALTAFAFTTVFTMNMVYQVTAVGLNPLQLVLVGTTLELTAFIFEIPTGVVADVYSRRLSIIIGFALIGLGFLVEAVPTFTTVLLAQVIWGFGYTFTSGATDAWLVDELGQEAATKALMRGSQVAQIASFVAIVVSVLLAFISLNTPHFVGGGVLIALSIVLIFIMPEDGFQRTPATERESWQGFFQVLRDGVKLIRARQILLMIVAASFLFGLFSEGWDRLWTAHFLTGFGLPPASEYQTLLIFGAMSMVGSILSLIATEVIRRRNLQSHKQLATALALSNGLVGVGIIAFAQAPSIFIAVLILWTIGVARTISQPLFSAWINQHTTSNVRATVLSVSSQANAIGQVVGGPAVGYIGTVGTLRLALSITGALMLPAVWVVARTRHMVSKDIVTQGAD